VSLFGLLTYASLRVGNLNQLRHHDRYFWWGSVRLDSDPLNRHRMSKPCSEVSNDDCGSNPEFIWVDPGLIERALTLSAFPAFVLAISVAHGLAHLGVSELLSFMLAMPLGTLAWFYGVGWLLDHWRFKRSLRRTSVVTG
jgi:hypothetical protein